MIKDRQLGGIAQNVTAHVTTPKFKLVQYFWFWVREEMHVSIQTTYAHLVVLWGFKYRTCKYRDSWGIL
jgi:hypothetical protein